MPGAYEREIALAGRVVAGEDRAAVAEQEEDLSSETLAEWTEVFKRAATVALDAGFAAPYLTGAFFQLIQDPRHTGPFESLDLVQCQQLPAGEDGVFGVSGSVERLADLTDLALEEDPEEIDEPSRPRWHFWGRCEDGKLSLILEPDANTGDRGAAVLNRYNAKGHALAGAGSVGKGELRSFWWERCGEEPWRDYLRARRREQHGRAEYSQAVTRVSRALSRGPAPLENVARRVAPVVLRLLPSDDHHPRPFRPRYTRPDRAELLTAACRCLTDETMESGEALWGDVPLSRWVTLIRSSAALAFEARDGELTGDYYQLAYNTAGDFAASCHSLDRVTCWQLPNDEDGVSRLHGFITRCEDNLEDRDHPSSTTPDPSKQLKSWQFEARCSAEGQITGMFWSTKPAQDSRGVFQLQVIRERALALAGSSSEEDGPIVPCTEGQYFRLHYEMDGGRGVVHVDNVPKLRSIRWERCGNETPEDYLARALQPSTEAAAPTNPTRPNRRLRPR